VQAISPDEKKNTLPTVKKIQYVAVKAMNRYKRGLIRDRSFTQRGVDSAGLGSLASRRLVLQVQVAAVQW
jgi:hypothetical protein